MSGGSAHHDHRHDAGDHRVRTDPRCLPRQGLRRGARRRGTASSIPSSGSCTACSASIPSGSSAGRSTPSRCWPSASSGCSWCTACSGCRSTCPFNPNGFPGIDPALVVQHGRQLRDQHELAELRRREHPRPPRPDGRAGRAELRLGGGRAWPSLSLSSAAWPGGPRRPSATSGSTSPAPSPASCVPLAVVFTVVLISQGVIQNLSGYRDGHDAGGRRAVDPRRPGGQPDRHQAPRHERRRLPQRQLHPPVREPQRHHELPADLHACSSSRSPSPSPSGAWSATGGRARWCSA